MRRVALALSLSLLTFLAVACAKKDAPVPPKAAEAVEAAVPKDLKEIAEKAKSAPAPAVAVTHLDCEKVVPKGLRAKYFGGASAEAKPICPGCPEACKIAADDASAPPQASVLVDCRVASRADWMKQTAAMLESRMTKIDGLGRLAFTMGGMQTVFVPSKHDCLVTVTWMGNDGKLLDFSKELDAGLVDGAI